MKFLLLVFFFSFLVSYFSLFLSFPPSCRFVGFVGHLSAGPSSASRQPLPAMAVPRVVIVLAGGAWRSRKLLPPGRCLIMGMWCARTPSLGTAALVWS